MKRILLIEDNNDIRENTAEILELSNYKVYTAENGKVGVEQALKHKPDLIICDIMMPVLDGYGVLHMLHKNTELQSIPFIFLSAKTERGDIRKGMELGADDYITKPFNGTELLSAIESRLKKAELLKQDLPSGLKGIDSLVQSVSGLDALKEFTQNRTSNKYKKKQVIYSEGNYPSRLYYVVQGKVRTYKVNDDGKELVVGLYNEGDFLGHFSLLEGSPYKETAEAIEESEVAIIPKEDFEKLMNTNSQVARKFVQLLAKHVSDLEEQMLNLAYSSLRKKVAEALLALYRKYHQGNANFSIDMSRENLASIAGTAKESMIRTLGDFKEEKIIDIKDGSIVILNEKKLENMAN